MFQKQELVPILLGRNERKKRRRLNKRFVSQTTDKEAAAARKKRARSRQKIQKLARKKNRA